VAIRRLATQAITFAGPGAWIASQQALAIMCAVWAVICSETKVRKEGEISCRLAD
jgi:hypothetical protein